MGVESPFRSTLKESAFKDTLEDPFEERAARGYSSMDSMNPFRVGYSYTDRLNNKCLLTRGCPVQEDRAVSSLHNCPSSQHLLSKWFNRPKEKETLENMNDLIFLGWLLHADIDILTWFFGHMSIRLTILTTNPHNLLFLYREKYRSDTLEQRIF